LIKELVKLGHEVIALAPETGFEDQLSSIGARFYSIPLERNGLNVFKDFKAIIAVLKILKKEKPDILLLYTIKPVVYGSLVGRVLGISNIYSIITGLGYAFTGDSLKKRVLGNIIKLLYKLGLKHNKKVFFQNPDDLQLFAKLNLVNENKQSILINGSGVDVEKYYHAEVNTESINFLLIARLIWDKGIGEYVEAARKLKMKYPHVDFAILGPFDSNPAAIKPKDIEAWVAEGAVTYLDRTDDVRPYIAESSVYVLPSYREGTPRSVLEAMSMGRPIITTDAPGCRETVQHGVNGFLVPVKDSNALAEAMEFFILNPDKIPIMGAKSHEIVVEKYDVRKVNKVILENLSLIS